MTDRDLSAWVFEPLRKSTEAAARRAEELAQVRRALALMTPSDRVEFFAALQAEFCQRCGGMRADCKGYCENDE